MKRNVWCDLRLAFVSQDRYPALVGLSRCLWEKNDICLVLELPWAAWILLETCFSPSPFIVAKLRPIVPTVFAWEPSWAEGLYWSIRISVGVVTGTGEQSHSDTYHHAVGTLEFLFEALEYFFFPSCNFISLDGEPQELLWKSPSVAVF